MAITQTVKVVQNSSTTQNVLMGTGGTATGVSGLLSFIRANWPMLTFWPPEYDIFIVAFLTSTVGPWLSRKIAFMRDKNKAKFAAANLGAVPRYHLLPFILAAGVGLSLSGCATMLPAVGGKTSYNVEFLDKTAEQDTQYRMNIKAPAGVELASITGMTYDWQPDGSGAINVSQQGQVDSNGQAALIAEVSRQQLEAMQAGMNMALNALVPILGQHLQSKDNLAAIRATRDATTPEE